MPPGGAPNTRGIRAGRAFVELGVSDKLTAGLRRAQQRLKAFGEGVRAAGLRLTALGAGVLAPLAASVKVFSNTGDALDKMAIRTGISVEALSELGFAAEQSGADLETLETGVRILQRSISDAERGMSTATDAFAELNLTAAALRGLSPEDQFKLVADRLSQVIDPAKRTALAMQLLGRSGTRLIPLLEGGAAGIEELQKEARAFGLTVSTETAAEAALLNDTLNILWRVLKQGVFVIGSALAPVVTELTGRIAKAIVSVNDWIRNNKGLIVTAAKVAAGVVAAGVSLIGLGLLISGIGAAFGVLASVVAGVGTALGVVGAVVAALLSPIGLVIAAVAGLGTALLVWSGAGADALAWLGEQFGRLRDFATKVLGGITDALAAGDIPLAAQILWLALQLVWQKGVASLSRIWLGARDFFVTTAQKMWFGAIAAAQMGFHALEIGWIETTAFLSKTWTNFASGFRKVWETATSFVAKRMLEIQGLFDSSLDVDAAKRIIDDQLDSRLGEIDRGAQRDLSERETRRQRERDAAASLNEATLAEIGRQFEQAQEALKSGNDTRIAETERALEEARRKLDEAIAEARRKREETDTGTDVPRRSPADLLSELEDRLGSLGERIGRGIEVRGTFSGAAVAGLASSGTAAERTARASEQTARNTKRLVDAAQSGGLAFG
jgi:hypothetical protein